MIFSQPLVTPNGDRAFRVCFGDERSLEVNRPVLALAELLRAKPLPGVVELVSTYASLTVLYDPALVEPAALRPGLEAVARRALAFQKESSSGRLLLIPVCYQDQYAPDMEYICSYNQLEPSAAIDLHTSQPYHVLQLGFTPGCPFIGPLQEKLHVPLMQSPRTSTPKGAVAVSVGQTVIYPRATPGGMRIMGRTPVQLFDLEHPDLTLCKPGDQVRFTRITPAEYLDLKHKALGLYEGVDLREIG